MTCTKQEDQQMVLATPLWQTLDLPLKLSMLNGAAFYMQYTLEAQREFA